MSIVPFIQQKEACKAILTALAKTMRALVVMATGLGKTIAVALAIRKLGKFPGIVLVHDNGILENDMKEFRKVFGNKLKFGVYNGLKKDVEGADIVFATFQTMQKNLQRFKRTQFKWMVVDEGHHSHAQTFREVINYFWCLKVAMTATPDRMDMQDIRELFGSEVYNLPLEEAIARGLLPPIEYHLMMDRYFDEVALAHLVRKALEKRKRVGIKELNSCIFIRARDRKIASKIRKYGKRSVIFCKSIYHAENMRKVVPNSVTYHSGNSHEKNRSAIECFESGSASHIIAVNAFNEGHHIPDTDLVVFNRATESETIFYQQLGRGLHPGQRKLIVLDFVGSVERIMEVKNLADRIAEFHEKHTTKRQRSREGYAKDRFHLSGKGFKFTFADRIVKVIDVVTRLKTKFYSTWQEASEAAVVLKAKSRLEYKRLYKKDPRLPSNPEHFYADFPGYIVFLSIARFYSSWEEASRAAIKLGITTKENYGKFYQHDKFLPSSPRHTYPKFPGWKVFLGGKKEVKFYTYKQAVARVKRLKAVSFGDYTKKRLVDERLPADPPSSYPKSWTSWFDFLSKKRPAKLYSTWQQAGKAAQALGIKTKVDYVEKCERDKRLPRDPGTKFDNFPGWPKFLGRKTLILKKNPYPTWQAAAAAAKKMGVTTHKEYAAACKRNRKLYTDPLRVYPSCPDWKTFLGKN